MTEQSPSPTIRVLIVDDHEALASSLALALAAAEDIVAVGTARSIEEARALVPQGQPHVVLMDHALPDGDGVAAIPDLQVLWPSAEFVVLTASSADQVVVASVEAGAVGFLSKSRGLDEVRSAVRAAAAGEAVFSPELLSRLLPRLNPDRDLPRVELTLRELEVLSLISEGLTNAEIATSLVVSVNTVRNHVANLSAKLGAHSKLEALAIAIREGRLPRGDR